MKDRRSLFMDWTRPCTFRCSTYQLLPERGILCFKSAPSRYHDSARRIAGWSQILSLAKSLMSQLLGSIYSRAACTTAPCYACAAFRARPFSSARLAKIVFAIWHSRNWRRSGRFQADRVTSPQIVPGPSTPYNTPQRLVAERVYNAIRDSIVKQAPHYGTVMRNYEAAANEISHRPSDCGSPQSTTITRRPSSRIRNANSCSKAIVGTTKRSIDAIPSA